MNLVKWAGGKALLAEKFLKYFPNSSRTFYVEPFVGGGGSFLSLKSDFAAGSDQNQSLIYLWEAVRDDLEALIYGYDFYREYHSKDGYNAVRKLYNDLIADVGKYRIPDEKKQDIAILFLYLLSTSFNGLCRYSKKSGFNVPIGDKLPSSQALREKLLVVADRIKTTNFHCWDFEETIQHYQSKPGVFFYCDPPYSKIKGKGFQDYTDDWRDSDADRLKKVLTESGCRFAVSEIDCREVRDRYAECEFIEFQANRSIGGDRSKVAEVLILSRQ